MKKYIHPLEITEMMFCSCNDRQSITAAISTKDITKNLVRVRSSNIWAYGINIKNFGDKTGDVYVQFKGQNGGPEHIYVYYDVPIKTWKKMLSAPSKGHAFWVYLRNTFPYAKLTGDKRTKLPHGINSR